MTDDTTRAAPRRTAMHEALSVFLGEWKAEGTSYGDTDQSGGDPRAPGGEVFDTLSIMGVDPQTGAYFARAFENHGFYRDYPVTREGKVWAFNGQTERATITFSDEDRTQPIVWEWKPDGAWLPLCDRVATRLGR